MITKQGEALIAKYLLGQAPTYASYISFGCGAVPGQAPTGTETSMKFEMLRVPISSRSFVNEDDFNKISFAGELPLETQYKITEVALWSDAANALASSDSRVIFAFTQDENWKRSYNNQSLEISYIDEPLSGLDISQELGNIDTPANGYPGDGGDEVFACSASNQTLAVNERKLQGSRFLTRNIMMRGDTAQKIFIDGTNVNLSKNNPKDLLKFAFALYPKIAIPEVSYDSAPPVTITVKFMKDPTLDFAYTTFTGTVTNPTEFNIIQKELGELVDTQSFSWEQVRWVEISIDCGKYEWTATDGQTVFTTNKDMNPSMLQVYVNGVAISKTDYTADKRSVTLADPANAGDLVQVHEDWYVCLDAMRFDNISTSNPLYVMSGYSIVPVADVLDEDGNVVGTEKAPIVKKANSNSYAEFRFGIGTS